MIRNLSATLMVFAISVAASIVSPATRAADSPPSQTPARTGPFPPSAGTPAPAAPRLSPEKIAEMCTPSDAYLGKAEFSGASFSGRVVDGEGKPIRDALVVLLWSAQRPNLSRLPSELGIVHAAETTTDTEGRFVFPAWGPNRINIYPGTGEGLLSKRAAELVREDPLVLIYKRGYVALVRDPEDEGKPVKRLLPGGTARSVLEGRDFRLSHDPYAEDPLSWSKGTVTSLMGTIIYWLSTTEKCVTARFPRSLAVAFAWQQARVAKTGDVYGGNGQIRSLLVCNDFRVAHGCPSMLSHSEMKK